jgi:hypothetical protein
MSAVSSLRAAVRAGSGGSGAQPDLEFKIVEVKSELSKQGRLGAIGLGAVLVSISIYLYTRPHAAGQ